MQTNFANTLSMLVGSLEDMMLTQAAALAETVERVAESILKVRSRLRPRGSYLRKSRKPCNKWTDKGKSKT